MAEDKASEATTAQAGDFQLAIRSVPEAPAATNQTVRPEFRLLDLPVELQEMILEYVRVLLPAFFFMAALYTRQIANHSTAGVEQ
jgi:hypothetical protein